MNEKRKLIKDSHLECTKIQRQAIIAILFIHKQAKYCMETTKIGRSRDTLR